MFSNNISVAKQTADGDAIVIKIKNSGKAKRYGVSIGTFSMLLFASEFTVIVFTSPLSHIRL